MNDRGWIEVLGQRAASRSDLTVKVADTVGDFEAAARLLHDAYAVAKLTRPHQSGIRAIPTRSPRRPRPYRHSQHRASTQATRTATLRGVASGSIAAVITAVTGQRVVVTHDTLAHAARHFVLPRDILLELLVRVLKDPTEVFCDSGPAPRRYWLFYRLDDGRYIVAVVKSTAGGDFLASVYPTGTTIRRKHARLRRIRI